MDISLDYAWRMGITKATFVPSQYKLRMREQQENIEIKTLIEFQKAWEIMKDRFMSNGVVQALVFSKILNTEDQIIRSMVTFRGYWCVRYSSSEIQDKLSLVVAALIGGIDSDCSSFGSITAIVLQKSNPDEMLILTQCTSFDAVVYQKLSGIEKIENVIFCQTFQSPFRHLCMGKFSKLFLCSRGRFSSSALGDIAHQSDEKVEASHAEKMAPALDPPMCGGSNVLNNISLEFLRSQTGSRHVQNVLEQCDEAVFQNMFANLIQHVCELLTDDYAHYAMQKLIQRCSKENRICILQLMSKDAERIICDKRGSFSIQSLIQVIQSKEEIMILDSMLSQTVESIAKISHGHYALQKFIQLHGNNHLHLYKNMSFTITPLSTCLYGMKTIKLIIDTVDPPYLIDVFKAVAFAWDALIFDQYGNYVFQRALVRSPQWLQVSMVNSVQSSLVSMAQQKFSSNIVERCIEVSEGHVRQKLVVVLFQSSNILIGDRFGNFVLQKALRYCDKTTFPEVKALVQNNLHQLTKKIQEKWIQLLNR